MTKNQKTYVLLAVVFTIWGILGFKVVKGLGANDPIKSEIQIDEPYMVKTIQKRESILIAADYRDPFLGTFPKKSEPKIAEQKKIVPLKSPKMNITYSGSVARNGAKKRMFFVTIDGQQHIMQRNQKIDGVTLVWGDQESITVKYPGHTETITLNQ